MVVSRIDFGYRGGNESLHTRYLFRGKLSVALHDQTNRCLGSCVLAFKEAGILKHKWSELSSLAKAGLISGVILILGSLLLGSLWLLNDDYQILFSELNAQDASAMVTELDRMKIPYRLAEGGTAILVERDAVYKTRLKLMGKGLDLRGGVGFEIFNNADLGMTEFAQKVNFQRALQGELARTIMSLDEVKSARVHLVLPDWVHHAPSRLIK